MSELCKHTNDTIVSCTFTNYHGVTCNEYLLSLEKFLSMPTRNLQRSKRPGLQPMMHENKKRRLHIGFGLLCCVSLMSLTSCQSVDNFFIELQQQPVKHTVLVFDPCEPPDPDTPRTYDALHRYLRGYSHDSLPTGCF